MSRKACVHVLRIGDTETADRTAAYDHRSAQVEAVADRSLVADAEAVIRIDREFGRASGSRVLCGGQLSGHGRSRSAREKRTGNTYDET